MTQVINSDNQEILEFYDAIDNIAPDSKKALIAPLRILKKEDIFTDSAKNIFLILIKEEVNSFVTDISTEKGREEIKSNGRKIAKIRNRIEGIKKSVTETWRVKTNEVNSQARDIKLRLENLEELTLKPLTDFNNAEKARIEAHEARIAGIEFYAKKNITDIAKAQDFLTNLESLLNSDWQEFKERAERAYNVSKSYLNEQIARLQEIARQQAELAELNRKEKEARQKERDEQIRRDAENKARLEAKAKAESERHAFLKAEEENRQYELRLQLEAQANIDAERKEAQKEKESLEKQIADQKAEADHLKREADAKALREKQEAERVEAERVKREADLEHRKRINNAIVTAFIDVAGITKEQAIEIIGAIAKKEIANISIAY